MFRCSCFVFWSLPGSGRQTQVGDFLVLDSNFLRPLWLHASRDHTSGPQMHRLETALWRRCCPSMFGNASLSLLCYRLFKFLLRDWLPWSGLHHYLIVMDCAARSTELGLAIKMKPCTSCCFYTLLLIDLHTLWVLNTVIHDSSHALCVFQALVQKGKRSLLLSEGKNDLSLCTTL
jgi:hypothetical protein